jgi:hypothetical protein
MSKKEFYEKYVQSEDDKMLDIIHKNARKHPNNDDYDDNDKIYQDDLKSLKFTAYVFLVMVFVMLVVIVGVLCLK